MAVLNTQVGPPSGAMAPAATPPMRSGKMGDLVASHLNPEYYENTYWGRKFYGSNGAVPSVTSLGLATAYTGLCLYNPAGSGVNLVVDKVGYSFLVAFPAAATIGLMVGYTAAGVVTAVAAASPGASSLIGPASTTPQGKCALSATLPIAPTVHTIFGEGLTGAITTLPENLNIVDLQGSLIIAPGGFVAIYTSTISGAASLAASFQWSEQPQ